MKKDIIRCRIRTWSRGWIWTEHQDRAGHQGHTGSDQDQDQDPTAAANQEAAEESGGSVPALVITQAEEPLGPGPAVTPAEPADPQRPQRPADLVIPVSPAEPGLSSSSDGGDMACSDLLSLRSDSLSLASEPTVSRTSEDDDNRSVTASSVMSLFHRVQLDPLEKDWLRSSALGNMAAQRQLLSQDSGLVLKKTALHWAAKQGRQEAVDMMLRSGADVNARSEHFSVFVSRVSTPTSDSVEMSFLQEIIIIIIIIIIILIPCVCPQGYTALHLAAIHGHQHVAHALINTYNAKTNLRDYHGKTAVHYWSGCSDAFNKPDCQSGSRFSRGRQTQRYVLPSLLMSRSRSQGQLNLDFGTVPQSVSQDALDLQV
ncbi:ankyrin repeat domain-containing protein SOWAHC [Chelmon rostratus]|uniref:ankyrin repeat domain-containing protein SOWAHC n=1 Tax=Chelmon rostratus TaxID=109905 RepID=UPI001BE549B3|nr:ankyrin repeat domain-containing protein SOWAHC [Chelmon rostratus]